MIIVQFYIKQKLKIFFMAENTPFWILFHKFKKYRRVVAKLPLKKRFHSVRNFQRSLSRCIKNHSITWYDNPTSTATPVQKHIRCRQGCRQLIEISSNLRFSYTIGCRQLNSSINFWHKDYFKHNNHFQINRMFGH